MDVLFNYSGWTEAGIHPHHVSELSFACIDFRAIQYMQMDFCRSFHWSNNEYRDESMIHTSGRVFCWNNGDVDAKEDYGSAYFYEN